MFSMLKLKAEAGDRAVIGAFLKLGLKAVYYDFCRSVFVQRQILQPTEYASAAYSGNIKTQKGPL